MTSAYKLPASLPHGEIEQIFNDIYMVTGTVAMKMGLTMRFSRNMTIIRQDESLVLVNSVRLSEQGLARLDKMGKVTDVIRLAAFHGMDDPFYQSRYQARVWSVDAPYVKGFTMDPAPQQEYFKPDRILKSGEETPIEDAQVFEFSDARPKELNLLLPIENGTLISGDSLQNWTQPDEYFNLTASLLMRLMGFFKPCNIGPGWTKSAKPSARDFDRLLQWEFDSVLPSHGAPVIGNAQQQFLPAIRKYCSAG